MSQPQAPKQFWEEGFIPAALDNSLVTAVTGALGQAVQAGTQVIGDIVPSLPTIPGITTSAGSTPGGATGGLPSSITIPGTNITIGAGGGGTSGAVPVPTPAAPAGGTIPASTGNVIQDIENAALAAAKSSTSALAPSIQAAVEAKVAGAVQSEVGALIKHLDPGGAQPAVPDLSDFTKADARSRAFHTLLIGLVLSGLWGLVNVAGNLLTVDWTNKDALPQVISIAVTAVLGGVTAYIGRMLHEPAHVANATIVPNTSTPG